MCGVPPPSRSGKPWRRKTSWLLCLTMTIGACHCWPSFWQSGGVKFYMYENYDLLTEQIESLCVNWCELFYMIGGGVPPHVDTREISQENCSLYFSNLNLTRAYHTLSGTFAMWVSWNKPIIIVHASGGPSSRITYQVDCMQVVIWFARSRLYCKIKSMSCQK